MSLPILDPDLEEEMNNAEGHFNFWDDDYDMTEDYVPGIKLQNEEVPGQFTAPCQPTATFQPPA